MIRLLTIESEYDSACRLGYSTDVYVENFEEWNKGIVIRWGNSYKFYDQYYVRKDFDKVVNLAESICFNCSKNKSLEKLSKVVRTPAIYKEMVPAKKHVVIRPIFHSAGSGFEVKEGPLTIPEDYYATEFIETDVEYRVWFCNKNYLCARRANSKSVDKFPCRSNWGYNFCKLPNGLGENVVKAFKTLKLDFGAADILFKNNIFYFLELNTAPSIDLQKIEDFFTLNLKKLINSKFPDYKE